jgi:hypothetical protein
LDLGRWGRVFLAVGERWEAERFFFFLGVETGRARLAGWEREEVAELGVDGGFDLPLDDFRVDGLRAVADAALATERLLVFLDDDGVFSGVWAGELSSQGSYSSRQAGTCAKGTGIT